MKKQIFILTFFIQFLTQAVFSRSTTTEFKAGNEYFIMPDYLNKTSGLNDANTIQFKNEPEEVAGLVIEYTKEFLTQALLCCNSNTDFYGLFCKDLTQYVRKNKISIAAVKTEGMLKNFRCIAFYNFLKTDIYYFVDIDETKVALYKVPFLCASENKTKCKTDFQKFLYSLKN